MLPSPKIATSLRPKARRRPMARTRSDAVSMGRATIRCCGRAVTFLKTHSVPAPKATNPRTRISTPTRRRPRSSASRRSAALRNSLGRRGAAAAREARCSRMLAVRAAIISEAVISEAVGGGPASAGVAVFCCWSTQPRTAGSCMRFRSCCTCGGGGLCVAGAWALADGAPANTKNSSARLQRSRTGALWSRCSLIIETATFQRTPVCGSAQVLRTEAEQCRRVARNGKDQPMHTLFNEAEHTKPAGIASSSISEAL